MTTCHGPVSGWTPRYRRRRASTESKHGYGPAPGHRGEILRMKRSEHRILTTHTGSIQRPPELRDLHAAVQAGKPVDTAGMSQLVSRAVRDVVEQQASIGLAVINDGEMSRAS